jgi:hypothetical protein
LPDPKRTAKEGASMNEPDAIFTNGRYELPASAPGVFVVADPPEAGWRMQTPSIDESAANTELLAAPGRECDREQARDCDSG